MFKPIGFGRASPASARPSNTTCERACLSGRIGGHFSGHRIFFDTVIVLYKGTYESLGGGHLCGHLNGHIHALRGFVDGLREQLKLIREQQRDVTWENYVHDVFRDKNSPAQTRQRWLVLDLGNTEETVPVARISELTPRLAKAYAVKTAKTLQRDLRALER